MVIKILNPAIISYASAEPEQIVSNVLSQTCHNELCDDKKASVTPCDCGKCGGSAFYCSEECKMLNKKFHLYIFDRTRPSFEKCIKK